MPKQLSHTGAQLDSAIRKVMTTYADVSPTTAVPSDVLAGKVFISANRQEQVGTRPESFFGRDVTFKLQGNNYEFISVPAGKSIPAPVPPEIEGYYFKGWFTAESGGYSIPFPYYPAQSGEMAYGQLKAESQGLAFTSNGDGTCRLDGIGTCTDLDVVIPHTSTGGDVVTSIKYNAFKDNVTITSITLPKTIEQIGYSAFYRCTGLTDVYLEDVDAWFSVVFANETANPLFYAPNLYYISGEPVINVTVPYSVSAISAYLFYYCRTLQSVTLHDKVESIGRNAFYGCSAMSTATIGTGCESIGVLAFYNCTALTSVTIYATTPPQLANQGVFEHTNNCPIYVPAASVTAYQTATNWSALASRIQAIPST